MVNYIGNALKLISGQKYRVVKILASRSKSKIKWFELRPAAIAVVIDEAIDDALAPTFLHQVFAQESAQVIVNVQLQAF